jgi:hypothetical protein
MSQDTYHITNYCTIRHQIISDRSGRVTGNQEISLDDFLIEAYNAIKPEYPKFYKMDRLSKLGFLAAEVLLKGRSLKTEYSPEAIALTLSNANASLDTDIKYFDSTKNIASPALFVYTLPNIVAGEICIRHGIKGENAFFISEKFDPKGMSEYVSMVLKRPETEACLAGWIDVMDSHHDVFLYLAEKKQWVNSLEHSEKQLSELYYL